MPEADVLEKSERLGPIPRLCVEYDDEDLQILESSITEAISGITPNVIRQYVSQAGQLNMDAMSHKLFLIARDPKVIGTLGIHSISFASPNIEARVVDKLREFEKQQNIEAYTFLYNSPRGRGFAGSSFEGLAHILFGKGSSLNLRPMVRNPRVNGRWYPGHVPLTGDLETERQKSREHELKIQPKTTNKYRDLKVVLPIQSDTYYLPYKSNNPEFDSFILIGNILYWFKFTIASDHDIKGDLIEYAGRDGFPPLNNWRFIFVIEHQQILSVSSKNELTQVVALESALLNVRRIFNNRAK